MIQLNNRITGQVAIADLSIDYRTGIVWDIYSNGLRNFPAIRKSNGILIDVKKVPDVAMCFEDLKELLTYEALLSEESLQGFEISSDLKNWCVELGSANNETLYRVFVPNDLRNKCYDNRENINSPYFKLYELIMYCLTLPAFTQKGGVQYLEQIGNNEEEKQQLIALFDYFKPEGLVYEPKYQQIEGNINLV